MIDGSNPESASGVPSFWHPACGTESSILKNCVSQDRPPEEIRDLFLCISSRKNKEKRVHASYCWKAELFEGGGVDPPGRYFTGGMWGPSPGSASSGESVARARCDRWIPGIVSFRRPLFLAARMRHIHSEEQKSLFQKGTQTQRLSIISWHFKVPKMNKDRSMPGCWGAW